MTGMALAHCILNLKNIDFEAISKDYRLPILAHSGVRIDHKLGLVRVYRRFG